MRGSDVLETAIRLAETMALMSLTMTSVCAEALDGLLTSTGRRVMTCASARDYLSVPKIDWPSWLDSRHAGLARR